MLAQKSRASVTAVELDKDAANQARFNVNRSPWAHRIMVKQTSIQQFTQTNTESFDCIVSNPPFFDDALKGPDHQRNLARHTDTLSFADLTSVISTLLSDQGSAWILLPAVSSKLFLEYAEKTGLHPEKIIAIRSSERRQIHRHILILNRECQRSKGKLLTEELLTIHELSSGYTQDVIRIMKPYYQFM